MQSSVEKFGISDKRGRKMSHSDPFATEAGLPGVQICQGCRAVHHRKCWKSDRRLYEECLAGEFSWTTCPACQKAGENAPEGFLTLSGGYFERHRDELYNALHNTSEEAHGANPLERIMRRVDEGGEVRIETTTVKLAEKLGRAIHRSHQGELDIKWTGDPPTCRVFWHRDA